MPKFEIPRYATSAALPGSELLVGLLIRSGDPTLMPEGKDVSCERSGTRWPGIVHAWRSYPHSSPQIRLGESGLIWIESGRLEAPPGFEPGMEVLQTQ